MPNPITKVRHREHLANTKLGIKSLAAALLLIYPFNLKKSFTIRDIFRKSKLICIFLLLALCKIHPQKRMYI